MSFYHIPLQAHQSVVTERFILNLDRHLRAPDPSCSSSRTSILHYCSRPTPQSKHEAYLLCPPQSWICRCSTPAVNTSTNHNASTDIPSLLSPLDGIGATGFLRSRGCWLGVKRKTTRFTCSAGIASVADAAGGRREGDDTRSTPPRCGGCRLRKRIFRVRRRQHRVLPK